MDEPGAPTSPGGASRTRIDGATSSRMTTPAIERVALRLPDWMGSIRFRLTALYSVLLFGLAATLVAGIYLALAVRLDDEPMSREVPVVRLTPLPDGSTAVEQGTVRVDLRDFEADVNRRSLQLLRTYTFSALALLFLASLAVGWFVAGRVLAPIDRITAVTREIQATDLSRRIDLRGPPDELRDLADTIDDLLARLDEAFGQQRRFIQEASHELRNPLAVIRTNLEVALADPDADAEDLRATAEVVDRAVARMGVLVDDLLAYAREGAPERERSEVDLDDVLGDLVEEFAAPAAARRLAIESQPGAGAVVWGDRVALRQAVANLVANAIRLAPEGTTVRVATGTDGPWGWIAVDDAGPGISEEDRDRVFERFWRGDHQRARAEGRSGLGLAIVAQIAEAHGGEVKLHPNPRGGSTFTIWVPLRAQGASTVGGAPTQETVT